MLIGTNYNFNGNQLLNMVVHQGTGAPSTPIEGMMYTNTTSHTLNVYLNGSWTSLSTAGGTLTGGGATNQLAIWTGANSVGGITAVNSAVLVTNGSGVPSLATDIPTAVTIGGAYIYRAGGTDVPVSDGGTGLTALTQYGILYAPTTSTMGQITEITTGGKALVSAVAGAPVFGKVILTQPATGSTLTIVDGKTLTVNNSVTISASNDSSTLNIATGGTLGTAAFTASTAYIATSLMTTIGDLIYGGASGAATRLAGSAVNGTYVLTEVVVASTAVAPVWTATTSLTVAKATNLVGAAWGVPYQSATDTTLFVAQAGTANHVFLSGANNTAPTWSGGTLTLPASGSLSIPAFAVSFANAFAVTGAFSTSLTAGGNTTLTLPIVSGTLATLAGSEAFTNKSYNGITLTASTGTLTIPNATVAFSAAFATTGAFTTSLTQGANLTLALPPVATANMVYNTAAPGANNQLAYAAASSAALSYITAPAVLSVLTQSSNGAAPAWTTVTGTGSPVFGTDPTIAVSTQGKLTASYVPTADNDVTNKLYVDTMSVGLRDFKDSVVAATVNAGNITLAGGAPNSLDGVSLAANNRILVKNQTNAAENGIYYVATLGTGANGTWTRTTDADASTEVTLGLYVFVEGGSAANKGAWVLSSANANPIVLNTTLLTFSKFSNLSDLAAGNGIDITTNTVSVKVNASTTYLQYAIPYFDTTSSINRIALPTVNNQVLLGLTAGAPFFSKLVLTPPATNATITIADTKTFTVNNSLTLAGADAKTINFGSYSFTLVTTKDAVTYNISGTSSSSATQYLPTKYYTTITGTGPHTITHNLGTKDVTVAVYDNSDNLVVCDVVTTSTTVVTLTWGYGAPGASTFRVVVIG
jgi:hypothetical protein